MGKKEEKNKKIHELQLRFSYRLFGMPAERSSFGALADITVTTSYRGTSLKFTKPGTRNCSTVVQNLLVLVLKSMLFILGALHSSNSRIGARLGEICMGNVCCHEEDIGFLTPRTRARAEPPSLLLLRHGSGDGSSPRPMTPEERQYLRERKRIERLKQEAYLRSVSSQAASHRAARGGSQISKIERFIARDLHDSTEKDLPVVLEEAGDVFAHSAAGVLGSWGTGTVPAQVVPDCSPPRATKDEWLAKKSFEKVALAQERERSWTDALRHDKANGHSVGGRDNPSLLRDVSSALTAIVPAPSAAQAETDVLLAELSPAPSKPTVTFAQERISSPIRPPSIGGLGLKRGDSPSSSVTVGIAGGGLPGLNAR